MTCLHRGHSPAQVPLQLLIRLPKPLQRPSYLQRSNQLLHRSRKPTAAAESTAQQSRQSSPASVGYSGRSPEQGPSLTLVQGPATAGSSIHAPWTRLSPGTRQRLRVAVDVDEVLGRFLHSLNKFCLEDYGLCFDVPDYSVYDFAKVWKCSQDESNHIVHEFFKSRHFAVGILPIPGALHSLQRLMTYCDLVVVTSRQHVIREPTLTWVSQHFPGVFQEVHFGNHWALEGKSKPKSAICRDIGASVLIDDNPRYAVECAEAGIDVLLYDWQLAYPWSKTPDGPTHPRIRRVKDWSEVEDSLAAIYAARHVGP